MKVSLLEIRLVLADWVGIQHTRSWFPASCFVAVRLRCDGRAGRVRDPRAGLGQGQLSLHDVIVTDEAVARSTVEATVEADRLLGEGELWDGPRPAH